MEEVVQELSVDIFLKEEVVVELSVDIFRTLLFGFLKEKITVTLLQNPNSLTIFPVSGWDQYYLMEDDQDHPQQIALPSEGTLHLATKETTR